MSQTAQQFRIWVLRHWQEGGWKIAVDRIKTKKGIAAQQRLISDGMLEAMKDIPMFRLTDAGRAALAAAEGRG